MKINIDPTIINKLLVQSLLFDIILKNSYNLISYIKIRTNLVKLEIILYKN